MVCFTFFLLFLMALSVEALEITKVEYNSSSSHKGKVSIFSDGSLDFKLMFLPGSENTRLVMDFLGANSNLGKNSVSKGVVKGIRYGHYKKPLKTRIVLDLDPGCIKEDYSYSKTERGMTLDLYCPKVGVSEVKALSLNVAVPVKPKAPVKPVSQVTPVSEVKSVSPVKPVLPLKQDKITNPKKTEVKGATALKSKDNETSIAVKKITHEEVGENQEMVAIYLTGFVNPNLTAVDGDSLTVLCELPGTSLEENVLKNIPVNSRFVDKIKTEKTDDGSSLISLFLNNNYTYDLNQVFYKKENVLTLVVHSN